MCLQKLHAYLLSASEYILTPTTGRAYHAGFVHPRLLVRSAVDAALAQLIDTDRDGYGDFSSDPIVLIDGHWCPFSLESTTKKGDGHYRLRDPYAWESVSDAEAFLIPQWLSEAVGGDPVRCTKPDDRRGTSLFYDHVFGVVHASRLLLFHRPFPINLPLASA